jgi:hypothetical protein
MNNKSMLLAVLVVSGVFLFQVQASAQTSSPPPASASRPAKAPEQTSVPSNSPPATTTQTTGETNPDRTVKKMNEDEKKKVETEGK